MTARKSASKSKVASTIAVEPTVTQTAWTKMRAEFDAIYADAGIDNQKTSFARAVTGLVLSIITCSAVWYMAGPVIAMFVAAVTMFTGFMFLGFVAAVFAFILTWYIAKTVMVATMAAVLSPVVDAGIVKAKTAWSSITSRFATLKANHA